MLKATEHALGPPAIEKPAWVHLCRGVGRRDYRQPSPQQVPTWFEDSLYFGPCKIPMRPRMRAGDYVFGISPSGIKPRRIVFAGRIAQKLTYAQAYKQLPKLRGPTGPIHVRPTHSPGLGFPDSHYEHIPGANHPSDWRNDLRTEELDAFFVFEPATAVLGRWFAEQGPALSEDILDFLRTCEVHGSSGLLGKNVSCSISRPVAHGNLYRGLHLETDRPEDFLRWVSASVVPVSSQGNARVHKPSSRQYVCAPKRKTPSNVLFIRVGADQTEGGGSWNAPIDSVSNEFVYVPIPETKQVRSGMEKAYVTLSAPLAKFGVSLPDHLVSRHMHLDPDFESCTYGDRGAKGAQLSATLSAGDLIIFYAGLRSIRDDRSLLYAIIGVLSVHSVERAVDVEQNKWDFNAHTRRELAADADDVVVVGKTSESGRLAHALPIGAFRSGAYRVKSDLLEQWGGISSRDGFLQRSAVFPKALDPRAFAKWWDNSASRLLRLNNVAEDVKRDD